MQSHKRATPQPSPTHHPHTHTKWRQARRQVWHKASVPQQSEAPTTMVFCHHTHSQCNHQASQSKRHLVLVFVARLMPLTHTPQGCGEPWLMTRGVHHGSSHTHTHTSGQHTSHSATRSGACHGVHQPCHSHTPKEEDHGLMAKVASTTCHHNERERERDWMVDSGLVSVDKPLATQQGKRRHHSSHAAITQAYTNNHHTITLTTQAWSWSLTACSFTHTRAKAGQGAHHHQANGVDGLHSDHGVAQAWLWCGVAIKPCATRGGTHAIQVATCSPHCPTTTTTPVLSGVNTRATTSPHPSPRVCVTVALSHPPCPQVWSSTTVCPASPPPGPSSTTNHHHHQQQQHKSKRVW